MLWLIIILIIIILIVALINYISWGQYVVLFNPNKDMIWKPSIPHSNIFININESNDIIEINPNQLDNLSLDQKHNYIHGWYFNNFINSKTVLFCHGNTGNISHRKYIINACHKLGLNLLLFDYRGYGRSDSIPSKQSIRKDGIIMYKYLARNCNSNNIVIWGESLGGHVATYIASKYPCRCLILLSTFSSISDIILYSNKFKLFGNVMNSIIPFLIDILPSKNLIKKVKSPILIMHSKNDTVIPYQCAINMFENINHDNKYLEWIDGDHSSPIITDDQSKKMFMFMDHPIQKYRKQFNIQDMLTDINYVVNTHLNTKNSNNENISISFVHTE